MSLSVLLLHRTIGPEHDDRIQKIFESILSIGAASAHALLWERKNVTRNGEFLSGGSFEVLRLPFASKKLPRPGPLRSLYEVMLESIIGFFQVRNKSPSIVIVQNHRLFGLIQLLSLNLMREYRLVWDLRELPTGFMVQGSLRAWYFSTLLRKCDAVIVTNESRQAHMRQIFGGKALGKSVTVPNYPSREFTSSSCAGFAAPQITTHLTKSFLYLQNPSSSARYPQQTIEAALSYTNLPLVVSGRLDDKAKTNLEAMWGDEFQKRIILTGMIESAEIVSLLDRCTAALVFYNWDRPNNDFCDPNRLYQAIARGTPVVVGANQGMKPIVQRLGSGVVTDGDGRSVEDIGNALKNLIENRSIYRFNAMKSRDEFSWAVNEEKLLAAIFGDRLEASKLEGEL